MADEPFRALLDRVRRHQLNVRALLPACRWFDEPFVQLVQVDGLEARNLGCFGLKVLNMSVFITPTPNEQQHLDELLQRDPTCVHIKDLDAASLWDELVEVVVNVLQLGFIN
eukprot:CAMPEP_0204070970 /NCGR_PEP_ID=MMETSP0360-20130528/159311_1 /ASSEMBLY_ACC=CAM_ASM_000342 /TAXON_ID=268821 /ORGANISM="Scrippsiella Hangoei, Strain SHTV-5" /LENGTH=111 /DNA_ID=CAMNT_0051019219 /DNA_START=177 /DNA_END=509 /DNA_ORIENTATION=+